MDAGKPPTAVIFHDPSHTEWTAWDYKLIKAYHLHEQYMDGNFPIWIDRSDRVAFDVKRGISRSKAALDRAEERDAKKKAVPGAFLYAVPRTIDGGPLPTMEEWVAQEKAKNPEK